MKRVLMILAILLIIGLVFEATFAIWIKSENSDVFIPIEIGDLNASEKYQIFVPLTKENFSADDERSPYSKVKGRYDVEHGWFVLQEDPSFNINSIQGVGFVGLFSGPNVNRLTILSEKSLCIVTKEYCDECLDFNNENTRQNVCYVCGGRGYGTYDETNNTWATGEDCIACNGTGWVDCSCCTTKVLPVVKAMVDPDYKDYYVNNDSNRAVIDYIYIPASISEIDQGMFFNMTKLSTLEFETAYDKTLVMRKVAFGACTSLVMPNSVPRAGTFKISEVFKGCKTPT